MKVIVPIAFAFAAVFGLGGNFVQDPWQTHMWFVSSAGLIVGLVAVAGRMATEGRDQTAAGFLVLAFAETALTTMAGSADPAAVFAHGVGLYVPGLVLVASGDRFPAWVRGANLLAAAAFAAHWVLHVVGRDPAVGGPVSGIGYGLLVLSLVGWAIALGRHTGQGAPRATAPSRA